MLAPLELEIIKMMRRYEEARAATTRNLVTMELLGGGAGGGGRRIGSNSLVLHHLINLPPGLERRLHLLSRGALGDEDHRSIRAWTNAAALSRVRSSTPSVILPPAPPPSLDLKLFTPATECPSVCTLDKVKLALDRIKDPRQTESIRSQTESIRSQTESIRSPTSSSSSTGQKRGRSTRDGEDEEERQGAESGEDDPQGLQAAGCPSCLSYVLIAKNRGNPRCHRCNSPVHVPPVQKKYRIDLNSH